MNLGLTAHSLLPSSTEYFGMLILVCVTTKSSERIAVKATLQQEEQHALYDTSMKRMTRNSSLSFLDSQAEQKINEADDRSSSSSSSTKLTPGFLAVSMTLQSPNPNTINKYNNH